MTNLKLAEALPVPAALAFLLFAAFPTWQTSFVVVAAFAFIAFNRWIQETRHDEIAKLHEDMKALKDRLDAIQIGKTLGHHR